MATMNAQREDVASIIQNLLDCVEEGHNRGLQPPPSISMVSKMYRDQNPSCFDPQVISIGPLHRAHKNVQEYEGLKATYLHDLLARLDSPPKQILEECLLKVLGSIDQIKVCYGGITHYGDFELASMMVKDSCFILEFLKKRSDHKGMCPGNRFVMNRIRRDLVLLENQIPFFVLQDIFDSTLFKKAPTISLITLLLNHLLKSVRPFKATLQIVNHRRDRYHYKHILDLLHKAYQPNCVIPSRLLTDPISHSVEELDLTGINFKPILGGQNWLLAMEYESAGLFGFYRPTLKMPVLIIQDRTELVLRNLIAYEQSSLMNGHYFTSYACAMDMLVDTKEDVNKLVKSKVIINNIGSNESVANMINGICNEVFYKEFYYQTQWKQLDSYFNCYWPKNIARLRRTYFSSPWNIIALVAVVLLFVLTVIQTFFTVKSAL